MTVADVAGWFDVPVSLLATGGRGVPPWAGAQVFPRLEVDELDDPGDVSAASGEARS